MIPELPFDTEKTYRDRVATASFYLMRAGERAYIHEQLQARLEDRYTINEEFLKIYLTISELSTEERIWAYSFLDSILDPNISFSIIAKNNYDVEVYFAASAGHLLKEYIIVDEFLFLGDITDYGAIAPTVVVKEYIVADKIPVPDTTMDYGVTGTNQYTKEVHRE